MNTTLFHRQVAIIINESGKLVYLLFVGSLEMRGYLDSGWVFGSGK